MRQPKRSKIVGDNPERSKASFDPTSRHLASGQGPAVLPANTPPPRPTDRYHRLSSIPRLPIFTQRASLLLRSSLITATATDGHSILDNLWPQPTGPCCHLPGFHTAQPHCALTTGRSSMQCSGARLTDNHTI